MPSIVTGHRTVADLIGRGLDQGKIEHTSRIGWEWDIAGRCQRPQMIEIIGLPSRWLPARNFGHRVFVDLWCPCRKCEACLKGRRNLWARRAVSESHRSVRTWFVTLTLRPEQHYMMLSRAVARLKARGTEYSKLSEAQQFQERHLESGREITKYLKRLRQASQTQFRYVCVVEAHKSGLPHYHLLLHEVPGMPPLRHRELSAQWKLGFGKWELARTEDKSAWYVAKYLSKSARARVRASQRYGSPSETVQSGEEAPSLNLIPSGLGTRPPSRPLFKSATSEGSEHQDDATCQTAGISRVLIGQERIPMARHGLSETPAPVPWVIRMSP